MSIVERMKALEQLLPDPAGKRHPDDFEDACSKNWAFKVIAKEILNCPDIPPLIVCQWLTKRFEKLAVSSNPNLSHIFSVAEDMAKWVEDELTRN